MKNKVWQLFWVFLLFGVLTILAETVGDIENIEGSTRNRIIDILNSGSTSTNATTDARYLRKDVSDGTANTLTINTASITNGLTANGFTYPNTDGTTNQVMRTDGAKHLSFGTVSAGFDPSTNSFLSGTMNFTAPFTFFTNAVGHNVQIQVNSFGTAIFGVVSNGTSASPVWQIYSSTAGTTPELDFLNKKAINVTSSTALTFGNDWSSATYGGSTSTHNFLGSTTASNLVIGGTYILGNAGTSFSFKKAGTGTNLVFANSLALGAAQTNTFTITGCVTNDYLQCAWPSTLPVDSVWDMHVTANGTVSVIRIGLTTTASYSNSFSAIAEH